MGIPLVSNQYKWGEEIHIYYSIWNLIEVIIPALLGSHFFAKKNESQKVFWEHYKSQWENEWQDHFPPELFPPSQIGLKASTSCLQVKLGIPHCTPPLNPPLQKLNVLFLIFLLAYHWSQNRFFSLPIWIYHSLPCLYVLLFNNF